MIDAPCTRKQSSKRALGRASKDRWRAPGWLLALLMLSGCLGDPRAPGRRCSERTPCDEGELCYRGYCVLHESAESDAGGSDLSANDAGNGTTDRDSDERFPVAEQSDAAQSTVGDGSTAAQPVDAGLPMSESSPATPPGEEPTSPSPPQQPPTQPAPSKPPATQPPTSNPPASEDDGESDEPVCGLLCGLLSCKCCEVGKTACEDKCVNVEKDAKNCGGCGIQCTGECKNGVCKADH